MPAAGQFNLDLWYLGDGRSRKMTMTARRLGMLRFTAALAMFALTMAGGSAFAAPLTVGTSITTANGDIYTLESCSNSAVCGAASMSVSTSDPAAMAITGTAGGAGVLESVASGSVDTFLVFAVQSPIQATSVGFTATGCGDNSGVSGCGATTSSAQASATLYVNSSESFNGTWLGPSTGLKASFNAANPNATQIAANNIFSVTQTNYYIGIDLSASVSSGTSYASINSIEVLDAPEPASWAVFACGLVGFGMLRRRRII